MTALTLTVLLPVLAFFLLFVYLVGREGDASRDWRRSFVMASVGWGAYLTLTSEVLSLFRALSLLWVVLAWLLPVGVLFVLIRRSAVWPAAVVRLRDGVVSFSRTERALLAGLALVCTVLFAIAMISPPNTYDSALYHMARVVHWAQNASLRPYPALFEHQLHKPIWAETAILHLRVLWGNDRPAGLVQWFSMIGSLVAVSGLAGLLGGRRGAQILAAGFCISLPMGVMQATSTQNDYVAAYWAVALAYMVALSVRRALGRWELWVLAGAAGLGALTKGTFFVYGPPFLAWFFFHEWAARGFARAIRGAVVVAAAAGVLNAGFWARNIEVYGGPYGTSDWLQRNLWIRLPAGVNALGGDESPAPTAIPEAVAAPPEDWASQGIVGPEPIEGVSFNMPGRDFLVRVAQTAGRNLTLPTGFLRTRVVSVMALAPGVFDEGYLNEMRLAPWSFEDSAGNPVHLLFVPLSLAGLALFKGPGDRRLRLTYAGIASLTFAMIPVVIGHGASTFGIRYQLSFFVLWAPAVGVAFGLPSPGKLWSILVAAFLLSSVPWLLLNRVRPLVGMEPERTWVGSILVESQENLLIPWNPALRDDYVMATRAVADSGCKQVELRANAAYLEYPLWWLLDVPQSGIRVMSYQVSPYLEKYIDPDFEPCAVICANCDIETTARGMPLFETYDSIKVYLGE